MIYYGLMMKFQRVLSGLTLACMAFAAPAQTTQPAPADASRPPPAQSALTAPLMYELLVSEMLFGDGDAPDSVSLMLNAARRTSDEALYKRATEMAIQSRSGPAAIETTRAWRQAFPKSAQAAQYELQVLIVLGRVAETREPLQHFLTTLPEAEQAPFITALPALYQRVPDKPEAAHVVERALADAIKTPRLAPVAWTTVGRLRLQAGDKPGALAAATLGMDANPGSEWPALLALQLMGAGEKQAEALVQRHLASPQPVPEVRMGYARALVDQGRVDEAQRQLDTLITRTPDNPDAWLVRGALNADQRRDGAAESDLKHYLALLDANSQASNANVAEGRDQARLMLATLAERRGDYAAADKLLASVESPERALGAQTRRAQLLARQGKLEEGRALIRSVPERTPDDGQLKLLAEAQLLRDNGQPQAAYELLSAELQRDPDDDGLLYDAAMAAERAGHADIMEKLLRRLIALKPNAAHAYNALGYSLADRGERLPEAKALIEKALSLSPDDGYMQDSLGWVNFRMGNVAQARTILEAAFGKSPDPEIAAHLGEVLWTLGERDAARAVWRKGQALDADNDTLVNTLKRLRVSL